MSFSLATFPVRPEPSIALIIWLTLPFPAPVADLDSIPEINQSLFVHDETIALDNSFITWETKSGTERTTATMSKHHDVPGTCPRCKADYNLTINLSGMDKISVNTLADWIKENSVKVKGGKYPVQCWDCCRETGVGALPTGGRSWQK